MEHFSRRRSTFSYECVAVGTQEVPSQLAVPWCALSVFIGLPPVITLAAVSLSNYRIVDPLRYRQLVCNINSVTVEIWRRSELDHR